MHFTNTGYKPPKIPNPKNFIYEKTAATPPLPATCITDITPFKQASMIYMQEQIPDCVENAVTFVKRYHTWKATGVIPDLSRRFLAIETVAKDGFPFSDGTSIENALNVAYTQGICESSFLADDHTLDENTFISATPSVEAKNNATGHKISNYAFLSDKSVNGLKTAISNNGVVIIGIEVSDSWYTAVNGATSWEMNDILPIRPPSTAHPVISGHAIVLYGYDADNFYFMNWWSNEWGDVGHGWFQVNEVPYIYEAATIVDLTPEQLAIQGVKTSFMKNLQEEIITMGEDIKNLIVNI